MIKKKPVSAAPIPAWIRMPREVLASDAWRSVGINGRRVIDFLMIELAGTAGTQNGNLKAPYHQLVAFGVGKRYVTAAILQLETVGLVATYRGGQRVASTYALTWLPMLGGGAALDYWQSYRNPKKRPLSKPKPKNLPLKGRVSLPRNGGADEPFLPRNGRADEPKTLPLKGRDLSRKNLTTEVGYLSKKERGAAPVDVTATPAAAGKLRLVKAAAMEIATGSAARGGRS
jgi:hypothetical protein